MSGNKQYCSRCGLELGPDSAMHGCPHCLLLLALTADEETDLLERRAQAAQSLPPGLPTRFFADYEILEEIARGGMGVIYKARQLSLNRLVALKMIQGGHLVAAETRLRFRIEIEAVARLNHPHIVPLYESGEHDGNHFFSMRLVEGGSLAQEMAREAQGLVQRAPSRRSPFLRSSMKVGHFIAIARAVHYAHQRGILHRDLKPSNILIDSNGEPQVVDFGLAKMTESDSGITFTQAVLGSPNYMAPEQASPAGNEITVAADVYGLGAIFYELIAGQPPFKAPTPLETIRKVVDEDPLSPRKLNPFVDVDLETICLKCLRKNPAERYASAEELAVDVQRWMEGRPIAARPLGIGEQVGRWCLRQPALAAALAFSCLLMIALVVGTSVAGVRIHRAEVRAASHLRESLLSEAHTLTLSSLIGNRKESLRLIKKALSLGGSREFQDRARNEALIQMSRTDASFAPQAHLQSPPDPWLTLFDSTFVRMATVIDQTNIVVRSIRDGVEEHRFTTGDRPVVRLESFGASAKFLAMSHPDGWSVWEVASGTQCFVTNDTSRTFALAPHRPLLVLQDAPSELSLLELPGASLIGRHSVETGRSSDKRYQWELLAVSPDDQSILATRKGSRIAQLIDLQSGQVRRSMTNSSRCIAIAWSGTGDLLATATADGRVSVHYGATGRRWMNTRLASFPVNNLAFSRDDTLLAVSFSSGFIELIDINAIQTVLTFPCEAEQLAFDENGSRVGPLRRGSDFGWLAFDRPDEYFEFSAAHTTTQLDSCVFSPNGDVLVTGNLTNVNLCELTTGNFLQHLGGCRTSAFAFDPDGESVVAAGSPGIFRWAFRRQDGLVEDGEGVRLISGAGWRAFAFSLNGKNFAAANVRSNTAYLFDSTISNQIAQVGPHAGVDAIAVSPDARWIATGSTTDRQVKVWETASGRELLKLPVGARPRAIFSPDGKWLVAFGNSAHLYRTGLWQPAPRLPVSDPAVFGGASFSPDGRILAIVRDLYSVQLIDLEKWQDLGQLRPPLLRKLTALGFSPDGTRLAVAGDSGRIRVWNLRSVQNHLRELGLSWTVPVENRAKAGRVTSNLK